MCPGRGSPVLGPTSLFWCVLTEQHKGQLQGSPGARSGHQLLPESRSSGEGSTKRPPEPLEPFPERPRRTACRCSQEEQGPRCQGGETFLQKVPPNPGSAPGHPAWIGAEARTGDLLSYSVSLSHSPASLFHFTLLFLSLLQGRGETCVDFQAKCGAGQ